MLKNKLKKLLSNIYSNSELNAWFELISIFTEDDRVTTTFPYQLIYEFFKQKYKINFEKNILHLLGDGVTIFYSISSTPVTNRSSHHQHIEFTDNLLEKCKVSVDISSHTFSSFISNKKNSIPIKIAKSFSNFDENGPFTIFSPSSCGKSHLLFAIYNHVLSTNKQILILESLKILELFEKNSVKKLISEISAFKPRMILIDNIHHANSNEQIDLFFRWLVIYCMDNSISVATASDRHPANLIFLEKSISSYLTSGIVVDLKKPDLEVRLKFVMQQANLFNLNIKKFDALELCRMYTDLTSISGAIRKFQSFNEHSISDEQVKITSLMPKSQGKESFHLMTDFIIQCVADFFKIPITEIIGKSRKKEVTLPRHLSMYLCREIAGSSLDAIGNAFDRDHSSVIYSINKISGLIDSNNDMNNLVTLLKKKCMK